MWHHEAILPFFIIFFLAALTFTPPHALGGGGGGWPTIVRTWGGSGFDETYAVALDSSGNVYIAGRTNSTGQGGYDALLIKYDSVGNFQWGRTWGGAQDESAYGVAVDTSGAVYIVGSTMSFLLPALSSNEFIVKFDSNGGLLWQRIWSVQYYPTGSARSVTVDPAGNVMVLSLEGSLGEVTTWDANGNALAGMTTSVDGRAITSNSKNHVYLTGSATGIYSGKGVVVQAYANRTTNGYNDLGWGGSGIDAGYGIAVDSAGNIYVAGKTSSRGAGMDDAFVMKLNATNSVLWQRTWGGGGNDEAFGLALGSDGNLYVVGTTNSFGSNGDAFILKLTPQGSLIWQRTWGGSGLDQAFGLAVSSVGRAYITGYVSEAPPYLVGSTGNFTLGNPNLGTFSQVAGWGDHTPSITTGTPAGVSATASGSSMYSGKTDAFLLGYGPLATVTFITNPASAGAISLNGTIYSNNQNDNLTDGTYNAIAVVPSGYSFSGWVSTGSIIISNSNNNPTTVTVAGTGTLQAKFTHLSGAPLPSSLAAIIPLLASLAIRGRRRISQN